MSEPKWEDTEEITPLWDDTEELEPSAEQEDDRSITERLSSAGGQAVVGAGVGKGLQKTGEKLGEAASFVAEKARDAMPISRKDAELLKSLPLKGEDIQSVERYKKIKAEPGTVSQDVIDLVKETRKEGYEATKNIPEYLKQAGIEETPESLKANLEARAADMKPPGPKKVKAAQEAEARLADIQKRLDKAKSYYPEEEVKGKKKIQAIEDKIEDYKKKSFKKDQLDKIRNLEKQSIDEQLDAIKSNIRSKELEILEYQQGGAKSQDLIPIREEIKRLQIEEDGLKVQKRKLGENLQSRVSELKKSAQDDYGIIEEAKAEKKSIKRRLSDELAPKKKADLERLTGLKKEAEALVKQTALKPAMLGEEARKAFDDVTGFLANADTVEGEDLVRIRKNLQNQYGKEGYDKIRKALSEYMLEKAAEIEKVSPENTWLAERYRKATSAIAGADNLEKLIPLKKLQDVKTSTGLDDIDAAVGSSVKGDRYVGNVRTSDVLAGIMTEDVGLDDSERNWIREFLENKAKEADLEMLPEEAKRYRNMSKDLDLNRIAKSLSKSDAGELVSKGLDAGISKMGLAGFIKKAGQVGQEAVLTTKTGRALSKLMGTLGKGAKVVGKGVLKSLPVAGAVVGGSMGYAEAKEAGMSDEEAAAYAAFEAVNPIPVSGLQMEEIRKNEMERLQKSVLTKDPNKGLTLENGLESKTFTFPKKGNIRALQEGIANESSEAAQEYAGALDKKEEESQEDYDRRVSQIFTEPAFRELMRRAAKRRAGDVGREED